MNQPNARPIICGTDFSEPAQHAADVAAALSKRLGTHLLLVHGIDERGEIPYRHWPRLFAIDGPRLTSEAGRLRMSGLTVEERLVGGVPDDGVVRRAEKADARMIVVASSGRGAAARWLMGSISERIAETAWLPTLVVRDAAPFHAWLREERALKVFVGADFTPTSDAALRWVEELAKIAPCEVTVGYVDRHAEERGEQALHLPAGAPRAPEMHEMLTHDLREKARSLYGLDGVQVHVLPAADRVDLRLIELAHEANADLIVIGTHHWHGLSRLRHPSVSRRVLHEAKVSVACVPGHALAQGVAMIAAAFYPKDVILRLSDFKTNEYANLIGGRAFEPNEENPMIGFRGASRYYHPRYQAGFALECRAMKKVRDEMGLKNLKLMIPFCRTVEEGRRVQAEMEKHGLKRGEDGLELYVMCEIPSNVILADQFAEIFDGFSIGSNDLTQLILGVDRDSEIVAPIFDERNDAVKKMIASVIATAHAKGRKIGICGQAPSDYPDFAQFLVEQGIDSISLTPDNVLKTTLAIVDKERALASAK